MNKPTLRSPFEQGLPTEEGNPKPVVIVSCPDDEHTAVNSEVTSDNEDAKTVSLTTKKTLAAQSLSKLKLHTQLGAYLFAMDPTNVPTPPNSPVTPNTTNQQ